MSYRNVQFDGRFYIVKSSERSDGDALESHSSRETAEKALAILNAHEAKNGRGEGYWSIVERVR